MTFRCFLQVNMQKAVTISEFSVSDCISMSSCTQAQAQVASIRCGDWLSCSLSINRIDGRGGAKRSAALQN